MSLFEKRPLALASLSLLAASLATLWITLHRLSPLWLLIPILIFTVMALLLLYKKTKGAPLCVAVAFCLLLGILSQWLYAASLRSPLARTPEDHTLLISVEKAGAETSTYRLYTVSLEEIDGDPESLRLHLRVPKSVVSASLSRGDRLTVTGAFTADYTNDAYYYGDGIAGSFTLKSVLRHEEPASPGIKGRFSALNSFLSARLLSRVGGSEGALTAALLLGDRSSLPASVSLAFRRTGLSHTLALSGMHLSVLTLLLRRILRRLGAPRLLSCSLLLLFIGSYTLLSGAPLSLLRAAAMLTVAQIGTLVRRQPDAVTSLFFSVAIICLLSPGAIADLGLWLSFLSTLGILVAGELLRDKKKKNGRPSRLLGALFGSLMLTLFATLFTLLVSALAFGEFSLLSPLSNLFVSPLVSLLLILSPPLLLFGADSLYTRGVRHLASLILSLVERLSLLGGIYVSVAYPLLLCAILAFSVYLVILLVRRLGTTRAFLVRFTSASLLLAVTFLACHLTAERRDLLLYVRHDAGEYLVISSQGHTTVVDNSNSESSLYSLRSTLEESYITEIDTLILTHYTYDSPAYLSAMADMLRIGEVILAPDTHNTVARENTLFVAKERGIATKDAGGALRLTTGNVELRLLTDLVAPYLARSEIFLCASTATDDVIYASQSALALLPEKELASLAATAECIIVGVHPETDSTTRLPDLPLAPGSTLVTSPSVTLGELGEDVRLLTSPSVFSYPFK